MYANPEPARVFGPQLRSGSPVFGSSFEICTRLSPNQSGSIVATGNGKIRGAIQEKVHAFKGVPMAHLQRARADSCRPETTTWTGVRDALELGPASPQIPSQLIPESMAQQPAGDAHGTEDCLHLNVWTPGLSGKRPVMVWYHGGGYSAGSANWKMYDGANLASKQDVVVVTVNHRLNVFGYLYLAELGGDKFAQASNVGMLDLVASLEWVRDNIAAFGGDPGNVTIFGQSGGGGKVSTLLAMPAAKGLFHRAIAESGSEVKGVPRDRATEGAEAFMAELGLKPHQVDELQKMPQQQLLRGHARNQTVATGSGGGWPHAARPIHSIRWLLPSPPTCL